MHKQSSMKTIRLVPLVLAGFCGYIHTVINRRFDEIGALMSHGTGPDSVIATNSMLSSFAAGVPTISTGNSASLQSAGGISNAGGAPVPPFQPLDLGLLMGPAKDPLDHPENIEWRPPPAEVRVMADSEEYQKRLLQYTMDLLPNHKNPSTGGSKDNDAAKAENSDELNPKPYLFNDIDIIVPASGQDDRLMLLAKRLGVALRNFNAWYQTERIPAILRTLKQGDGDQETPEDANGVESTGPDLDLKFRLLVTRYPEDAQKTEEDFEALVEELSKLTSLPKDQIKLVRVGKDSEIPLKFNRAHARNVLHQNACNRDDCIITAFDVDMQVLPIFFHHALQSVLPHEKAYFPIVFSEYNPDTVQLVQDFLNSPERRAAADANHENYDPLLEPFSKDRGLWRDFGYGMYVLSGSDAQRFRFNEDFKLWGGEDTDFYKLVHNNMRVDRQREHGLIHAWHTKKCDPGKDIVTQDQWIDCWNSFNAMEGSALGLLLRPPLKVFYKEQFPGLPKTATAEKTEEKPNIITKIIPPSGEASSEKLDAMEEVDGVALNSKTDARNQAGPDNPSEGAGNGETGGGVADEHATELNLQQQDQKSPEKDDNGGDKKSPRNREEQMDNEQAQEALQTNLRRRLEGRNRDVMSTPRDEAQ